MLKTLTKKSNDKKKKKGFTLIELVIVIAIIAILAAIAVPKFMNITDDAKIKADIANAKTIESSITTALATDKLTYSDKSKGIVNLSDLLQSVPKGKATTGVFAATVDDKNNIVVKIVDADTNGDAVPEDVTDADKGTVVLGKAQDEKYKSK